MLSANYSRKHGMKNEKWTMKEKTSQYRAILKLYAREKKLESIETTKLKKKILKNLRDLKKDVKDYRKIVKDVSYGDKRLMRVALQGHKVFEIALKDAEPQDAFNTIFQDYNYYRKQLDKLTYEKTKLEKRVCVARSEYEKVLEEYEGRNVPTPLEVKFQERQQWLISGIQAAYAKSHAGIAIRETYDSILVILKKDAMYYDGVLKALRLDQREQSGIIYRTTIIGQLAVENLDDRRVKYKKLAEEVWVNMKERERTLEIMRVRCNDVWEYAKSLVRTESDPRLGKEPSENELDEDEKLQQEIKNLEDTFKTIKESLLIRSYEELFLRLEGQMKQKIKLSKIYKASLRERDTILTKKKHAELIVQTLEHSMVSGTTQYQTDKKTIREKIEEERERGKKSSDAIQAKGELLLRIRSALIHLSSVLMCIHSHHHHHGKKGTAHVPDHASEVTATCEDPTDPDALNMLNTLQKKAATLVHQTSYNLSDEKLERAKVVYHGYVAEYHSNSKYKTEEEEEQGMMFEHEVVDASVLTRAEIKMKSKQLVEANTHKDDD